ncbi:MAG: DUF4158 domain-containing protein, partial [Desulforhopalus sp.]
MKRIWDTDELAAVWSLKHDELNLLKTKPARNRLGFVVQLKHYLLTGRFLNNRSDISDPPLQYLANQLDLQGSDIQSYDFTGRSGKRHRTEILNFLGIQRITAHDKRVFTDWLIEELYPRGINVEEATEQAFGWFSKNKIESPTSTELNRLTRAAFNRYEKDLFITISDTLPPFSKEKMSLCLDNTDRAADFNNLKADPGRIGLDSVLVEIEKLHFIRSLELPFKLLQTINSKASKDYYQRICNESAWEVKQHPPEIRFSLLGIFLYFRQREIIDGLIELFILIVHRLTVKAERKLTKELL